MSGKIIQAKVADGFVVGHKAEVIVVKATGKNGQEKQFEFPATESAKDIIEKATEATLTKLPPDHKKKLIETVKVNKTFISKIGGSFSINLKQGFKIDFNLERKPKEVKRTIK